MKVNIYTGYYELYVTPKKLNAQFYKSMDLNDVPELIEDLEQGEGDFGEPEAIIYDKDLEPAMRKNGYWAAIFDQMDYLDDYTEPNFMLMRTMKNGQVLDEKRHKRTNASVRKSSMLKKKESINKISHSRKVESRDFYELIDDMVTFIDSRNYSDVESIQDLISITAQQIASAYEKKEDPIDNSQEDLIDAADAAIRKVLTNF